MSRTYKNAKSIGYEYWTSRPFNKGGQLPGRFAKKRTHKAERQQGKRHDANQEQAFAGQGSED